MEDSSNKELNNNVNGINDNILEDQNFDQISKSICKILVQNEDKKITGTGFLIQILIADIPYYYLMTNSNLITTEIIDSQKEIEIYYDFEKEKKSIILDKEEREINEYITNNLDITIIQILDKDNIDENYFLLPNLDYNNLENKKIFIPQFPKGNNLYSEGEITKIEKNEFVFKTNKIENSSGSPILLKNSSEVIGIVKSGNESNKYKNFGNFIYPISNFLNDIIIYNNDQYEGDLVSDKYEGKGKYSYDDGQYYIGEWKNGLRNGKGVQYYKNGDIEYEGDFVNDKYEGNGKYIWEDGSYYIGEWKNGLCNGKGTEYNKNGDIVYEGDFINDKHEGNGKLIFPDGRYYIGEFKKGKFDGKGVIHYKNGDIEYEGDFVDNNYEGIGKYYYESGEYYIGEYKNDKCQGKGKIYYKDGKIKYEGDFVNEKYEGKGTYYNKDGTYYKGEFNNGLLKGKGIIYNKDGTIEYKGYFDDDKFE